MFAKRVNDSLVFPSTTVNAAIEDVLDEPYYHGFMTRAEADPLLEKQGHFLLRRIQEKNNLNFIISVMWNDEKLHYKICQTRGKHFYYVVKEHMFTSIPQLILFHKIRRVPINNVVKAELHRHIERNHLAIYREQIVLGQKIGEGEFGEVFDGKLRLGLFSKVDCAIKTMKTTDGSLSVDDRISFLREANLMMKLKHKNIIQLYGICVYDEPILVVLEYAAGGSLLNHLRNAGNTSAPESKQQYCKDICAGMAYLERNLIIHRDLAARNCLLDAKMNVKVADFGLSVAGTTAIIRQGKVPIRYLAPETLMTGMFSSKTDVWSFGVVLYEIWSSGKVPYWGLDNKAVKEGVKEGTLRLQPPDETPNYISELMSLTFDIDPETRPSFTMIKKQFF